MANQSKVRQQTNNTHERSAKIKQEKKRENDAK